MLDIIYSFHKRRFSIELELDLELVRKQKIRKNQADLKPKQDKNRLNDKMTSISLKQRETMIKSNIKLVYDQVSELLRENRALSEKLQLAEIKIQNLNAMLEEKDAVILDCQKQNRRITCSNEDIDDKLAAIGLEVVHNDAGDIATSEPHSSSLPTDSSGSQTTEHERNTALDLDSTNSIVAVHSRTVSGDSGSITGTTQASNSKRADGETGRVNVQDFLTHALSASQSQDQIGSGAAGNGGHGSGNDTMKLVPSHSLESTAYAAADTLAVRHSKSVDHASNVERYNLLRQLSSSVSTNTVIQPSQSIGASIAPPPGMEMGSMIAPPGLPIEGGLHPHFTSAREASLLHSKMRLFGLCQKHEVDQRTVEWFLLPENAIYWETLARKLEEIDRRSTDGHFKVKNPSAWLTKFFNTIRAK